MSDYTQAKRQNNEVLDAVTLAHLDIYVYVLQDPATGRIFYVGKGGGKDFKGTGNERVLGHFDEAERFLNQDNKSTKKMSDKIRSILAVWERGETVQWFIVRYKLRDAAEAHHVEAALIDTLSLNSACIPDNIQGGHGRRSNGRMSPSDVALLNAPVVDPKEKLPPVLIFSIQNALAEAGRSPYDAVRGVWIIGEKARDIITQGPCLGVGLAHGISRVVVEITQWDVAANDAGKWEFHGNLIAGHELYGKNFSNVIDTAKGYWQWGGILGTEFNGDGSFKMFRGAADMEQVHSCTQACQAPVVTAPALHD